MAVMVLVNWWGINLEIGTSFNIVPNQLLTSFAFLTITEAQLVPPNPDEPEPNRCMMSPQKIEVGHILFEQIRPRVCSNKGADVLRWPGGLRSKTAAAFLLFKVCPTSIF
jgi:hypothetical protein